MRHHVDTLFVNRLTVAPDYQRRGVGSALVHAAERGTTAHQASLFADARSTSNLRFYQHLGYTIDRQHTDLVLLHKDLAAIPYGGAGGAQQGGRS